MKQKFSTKSLVVMALFAAILCVSAYISIPLPPTGFHLTLLNFVVTLIALLFSVEQSFFIIFVWFFLGIIGLPVYIGGAAGFGYIAGPLGGFTVSFLLVALLVPWTKGKEYHRIRYSIIAILSAFFVDFFGTVWLKFNAGMEWKAAFVAGFLPFIIVDILKAVVAAQIIPAFHRIMEQSSQTN